MPKTQTLSADSPQNAASNVMLFYKNVVPLNRDLHKDLSLKPVEGFGFATKTHWLPLAGVEFYAASRHYPILFVPEGEGDKQTVAPIALVGLKPGRNEAIAADGNWLENAYVPAFVRRYPFVLASLGETSKPEELMVCIDTEFPGFKTKDGTPLFDKDGKETPLLQQAVQFLNGFKNDMERTQAFVKELSRLDLLEKRSAAMQASGGEVFQVQDFLAVSEEKFAKLGAADLAKLHKEGFLGWVFAHLMSLANLPILFDRHRARNKAS